jgi:hypothetical protein
MNRFLNNFHHLLIVITILKLLNCQFIDRCYVCISSSSRNCADGNNLVFTDSQECQPNTRYCVKETLQGHVSRSCAPTCENYESNAKVVKCCQSPLCNDKRLDNNIDRCYVCDSSTNRNCYDGNKLTYAETESCSPPGAYCKRTYANGVVTRSCALSCIDNNNNGVVTRCCTSPMCNDIRLDGVPLNFINKCYVCNSNENPNCVNGQRLTALDIGQCRIGTYYCMVIIKLINFDFKLKLEIN